MNLLEIYCSVDDFLKIFYPEYKKHLLSNGYKQRIRENRLSMSEIITILIYFHYSHYRDFKAYYITHVCGNLIKEFPNVLSYKRFVALIGQILVPLCAYLQSLKKTSDGISNGDSTTITVCHPKRISNNKVFAGIAAIGKSTKGWFYGLKLHLLCNHKGELLSCKITPGNIDDRAPLPDMVQNIFGKLFGDKGYISQNLFDKLFAQGLHLVTGIKKNMKNKLMLMFDKIMLRKRALIESINNQLKFVFQMEHHRHRSPVNGLVNILCSLVAYIHYPNKPSINLTKKESLLLDSIC